VNNARKSAVKVALQSGRMPPGQTGHEGQAAELMSEIEPLVPYMVW
jgi:hypothetical protein